MRSVQVSSSLDVEGKTFANEQLRGWRTWSNALSTPLLRCDVGQCLVENPLVPERVIDGGLPLAVLPVVGRLDQEGVSCQGSLEDYADVGDLEHHLVRVSPLGGSPSRPNLRHHQFGWRSVRQAEL